MFATTPILIQSFCRKLRRGYRRMYGNWHHDFEDILSWAGKMALETLANGDALYHNAEHTMLVTMVGQEVLFGKHMREGGITPEDWLHCIISLLFHDIGFVKGVCRQDRKDEGLFSAGKNGMMISLPPGSSDASLNPYHVNRGKLFIEERFGGHHLIRADVVKRNIELTRFPVPADEDHQDTQNFPGLVRSADLIGQLSDPRYLKKLGALFYEFEETGINKALGYRDPGDLRKNYPRFYWQAVYRYIKDAICYLRLTQQGNQILANLYAHVFVIEHEEPEDDHKAPSNKEPAFQGKPVAHWLDRLKGDDRFVRMQAATALAQMGPEAKTAVPALTEALHDADEGIRQWAAHALGEIGPGASSASAGLKKALADANPFVRLKAAEALWLIERQPAEGVKRLVDLLTHESWMVRSAAALALGRIGPDAIAALPALAGAMNDATSEVRRVALESLRNVDSGAVFAALTGALTAEDKYARTEAAFALGQLGAEARAAVPALLTTLTDSSWVVRRAALLALGDIGPDASAAVPALVQLLEDVDGHVRETAAEALGKLGPEARAAIDALGQLRADRDGDVGRAAADALKRIQTAE